jgi:hypothetical protein
VLTAGLTTTVTNKIVQPDSVIIIQPTGSYFESNISLKSAGSFVIDHLMAVGTEAFDYVII